MKSNISAWVMAIFHINYSRSIPTPHPWIGAWCHSTDQSCLELTIQSRLSLNLRWLSCLDTLDLFKTLTLNMSTWIQPPCPKAAVPPQRSGWVQQMNISVSYLLPSWVRKTHTGTSNPDLVLKHFVDVRLSCPKLQRQEGNFPGIGVDSGKLRADQPHQAGERRKSLPRRQSGTC